jgi:phage gpG-like protein
MARVHVDDKQARLGMKLRFERADDFRPIFRWARDALGRANARNFATRGATSGSPWMPLDDEYARWKLTHGGPKPLLVWSGKLRQSLTSLRGSPNEIDKTKAVFGTDVTTSKGKPLARYHQDGTSKMPARKIVFVPPLFAATMAQKTATYIVHGNFGVSGTVLKGLF